MLLLDNGQLGIGVGKHFKSRIRHLRPFRPLAFPPPFFPLRFLARPKLMRRRKAVTEALRRFFFPPFLLPPFPLGRFDTPRPFLREAVFFLFLPLGAALVRLPSRRFPRFLDARSEVTISASLSWGSTRSSSSPTGLAFRFRGAVPPKRL